MRSALGLLRGEEIELARVSELAAELVDRPHMAADGRRDRIGRRWLLQHESRGGGGEARRPGQAGTRSACRISGGVDPDDRGHFRGDR